MAISFKFILFLAAGTLFPLFSEQLIIVGYNEVPCFWLTDDQGAAVVEHSLPGNHFGNAFDVATLLSKAYIVGSSDANTPALWIVGSNGSQSDNPLVLDVDSVAYGVALTTSNAYIIGTKVINGKHYPILWITDLSGALVHSIQLSENYGFCNAVALSSTHVYAVGSYCNGDTLYPGMWITDMDGGDLTFVELSNLPINSPLGVCFKSDKVYIVGELDFNPYLLITNETGSAIETILLPDSDAQSPNDIALSSTNCYIAGNTSNDTYWTSGLDGEDATSVILLNNGSGGSVTGVALSSTNACYVGTSAEDSGFPSLWIVNLQSPFSQSWIQVQDFYGPSCNKIAIFLETTINKKPPTELFRQVKLNNPGKSL